MSIYNAKSESGKTPNLASQIKLFRDGKPVFEGKVLPITPGHQTDPKTLSYMGSLSLGTELIAGDYVMEIIVTDNFANDKPKTAVQFVQFEIVD
jgi:hypothetical protein